MPGSTYLVLTNKLLRMFNEVELTSGNFASAGDFQAFAKDAINYAIRFINQAEIEWSFNVAAGEITLTTDGAYEYALSASALSVDWNSFRVRKAVPDSTVKERWLPYLSYEEWLKAGHRDNAANATSAQYGTPEFIVPTQNLKVATSRPADKAYKINYEYWSVPNDLSAAGDTTSIPTQFDHVIISYAAFMCHKHRSDLDFANIERANFKEGLQYMRTLLINKPDSVYDTRFVNAPVTWSRF